MYRSLFRDASCSRRRGRWRRRWRRGERTHRDVFILIVGAACQRHADAAAQHLAVNDGHDDLVRRRAGLLERLVRLVNQLLQLLRRHTTSALSPEPAGGGSHSTVYKWSWTWGKYGYPRLNGQFFAVPKIHPTVVVLRRIVELD